MAAQPFEKKLRLCSYNSHGMGTGRIEYIRFLLNECDVLLVQEHWLLKEQFASFESNFSNAHLYAVSGMKSDVLVSGRPFGGCAILVNANWSVNIHPIELQSRRACGIRVDVNGSDLLIFNVYMPCDTEYDSQNVEEYNTILAEIRSICHLLPSELVIIGGDFNTCFDRNRSLHAMSLNKYMNDNSLTCGLNHPESTVTYTYESKIDGTRSLVDHFLLSESLFRDLIRYCVIDTGENMSDHVALLVELKVDMRLSESNEPETKPCGMRWATATENDIRLYKAMLDFKLLSVDPPREALDCRNFLCKEHTDSLNIMFDSVCNACIESSVHLIKRKRRRVPIAGWSEHVQGFKDSALLWHRIWKDNDRPAYGLLFDLRKSTRKKYHAALKRVKADEEHIQSSKMANDLLSNNHRDLWTEVRKVRASQKSRQVLVVDDHRDGDICTLFGEKYNSLYNSVSYDRGEMDMLSRSIDDKIDSLCVNSNCYSPHAVTALEVERAIRKLNAGKSDGRQRLYTDHLKMATPTLHLILALLFTALVNHGTVPPDFEISTLIPIPKGSNKSLSNSENYRAIAMSSVICKLLDHVLLHSHSHVLMSSDLQFGFKAHHSTMTCNFVLQEVVQHYVTNGSKVFCLSLDASKAFDRVQYIKLFKLLMSRKMCPIIVRFLTYMYSRQRISVRWGNEQSQEYSISNGVKQGGVMSPILFAVYLDELLLKLKDLGFGCHVGPTFAGAIAYADDVCLLAPSLCSLRQMLNVTEQFANQYQVKFNPNKSILVVLGRHTFVNAPQLSFMGQLIPCALSAKHLGLQIGKNANSDNILNSVADVYARTNGLKTHFKHIPWRVRLKLFNSFCIHLYGCESWDICSQTMESFLVAYRKCVRYLINLPSRTHRVFIPIICNSTPIENKIMNRIAKFAYKTSTSTNKLVKACSVAMRRGSGSNLSQSVSFICAKYNIHRFRIFEQCHSFQPKANSTQSLINSNTICELLDLLDSTSTIDNFSHDDIQTMLTIICEN